LLNSHGEATNKEEKRRVKGRAMGRAESTERAQIKFCYDARRQRMGTRMNDGGDEETERKGNSCVPQGERAKKDTRQHTQAISDPRRHDDRSQSRATRQSHRMARGEQ